MSVVLPSNPAKAASPACSSAAGAVIGFLNTGVAIFNALDAGGKDAPAHEIQDSCDGHPEVTGQYHYHSLPRCIAVGSKKKHSKRIGWARDGFPIFGPRGAKGEYMLNNDLDACHGHTHRSGSTASGTALPLPRDDAVPVHARLLPGNPGQVSGGGRFCPGVRGTCLDAYYERSHRSLISASGSVDPWGTSPAPHLPEDVPLGSKVLPSG